MSRQNDTLTTVFAIAITSGIALLGGHWLLTRASKNAAQNSLTQPAASTSTAPDSSLDRTQPTNPSGSQTERFTQVAGLPKGTFSYGGSTTWAPIRRDVDAAIQAALPDFRLTYTNPPEGKTPGSGTGIEMLIQKQLTFAQSSRGLKESEKQAAQQQGQTLKEVPVAIDAIAVAVHPSLEIPGLTIEQLKGIYTGKITNWREVGGPELNITPYSRRLQDSGSVEFLVKDFLKIELGSEVQFAYETTEGVQKVARDPGGIYFASAPEIVGQCLVKPLPLGVDANNFVAPYQPPLIPASQCPRLRNQLNADVFYKERYPITRKLYVIVRQNGQIEQQAGDIYANLLLTKEGQDLLEKSGFVRLPR